MTSAPTTNRAETSKHIHLPNQESLSVQHAVMPPRSLAEAAASPCVIERYRTVLQLQRKCIEEERGLWELERQRLNDYISTLETSLMWFQVDTIDKYVNPEKPRPASTGNEVWRGASAKGKAAVTKASRDSSIDSSKVDERLPHGAEDASSGKSKAPFVLGTGISVPGNDKDLDGINFKENIRAPPIAESLMASQSPTPLRLQSPARGIPATGLKPSPLLFVRADLNTKGAGHASTASQASCTVDSTALSSSLATPVQMHQQTSPPEPRPSAVKNPSGRVERYLAPLEQGSGGGDTELKGPLGLKNNNLEDKVFLRELDSKLLEAARSRTVELVGQINRSDNSSDDLDLDQPEPELQLKPSMNFGSPFGAPYCGKGI